MADRRGLATVGRIPPPRVPEEPIICRSSSLLFPYVGSKANLSRWHVSLFPSLARFVSVFGGAASEFLWRKPTGEEFLNDRDDDLHNVFSVVKCPRRCAALKRLLLCTPHGRRQFQECKAAMDDADSVRRAWAFLVVATTGDFRSRVRSRVWSVAKDYLYGLPERLDWWRDRLRFVQLECSPWEAVVERHDREDALLFCDPPYHPGTFGTPDDRFYRHMMTAKEHIDLLLRLKKCKARVLISGYPHPDYDWLLSGWTRLEAETRCDFAARKNRTEVAWLNYEPRRA